jgi:hypothetical protein
MFKSPFLRIAAVVLILCSIVLPAGSADNGDILTADDSLRVAGPEPDSISGTGVVVDSTLNRLSDPTFNQTLDQAIMYQHRADSLRHLSIEWRKEAGRMDDPVERGRLQKRIEQVEDSMSWFGNLADEQFLLLAEGADAVREPGTPHQFLVRDTVLNGITVYRYRLTEEFMARLVEIRSGDAGTQQEKAVKDWKKKQVEEKASGNGQADTLRTEKGQAVTRNQGSKSSGADKAKVQPGTGLVILDRSPYSRETPFELDYAIPREVFYRIQIAVYRNQVAWDQFGGLSPITTESIPGKGMTRYFAGKFTRMEEAQKALLRVKSLGYPDAFIVGYYNGQKGSFSKLKALEKE